MYHSLHVSVQKNVSSATRPFLFCPASGYFASLAKVLLNLCTPQDRRSRPHRRRSFTLVESSHSSLHNHDISSIRHLYVFLSSSLSSFSLYITTDLPFRALICSIQHPAPVHVPYSTRYSTRGHPSTCASVLFLRLCSPPLWTLTHYVTILIELAWVHH